MAETSLLPLLIGKEQDAEIIYGEQRLKFEFRYNDVNGYWFINNITNTNDDSVIVSGLKIIVGNDIFSSLSYLQLGQLSLIDTTPTDSTAIDMFNDFGDRLKLYRYY